MGGRGTRRGRDLFCGTMADDCRRGGLCDCVAVVVVVPRRVRTRARRRRSRSAACPQVYQWRVTGGLGWAELVVLDVMCAGHGAETVENDRSRMMLLGE